LYAEEAVYTQNIRGVVYDADSRITLIGVNVIVLDSDPLIGTSTDIDGEFVLSGLPVGRYTLKFQYLGYEDKVMPNVLLGSGKEMVLTVFLEESTTSLDEISVSAKKNRAEAQNHMATVSARSFTVEETKRYAGSFNDPARMASAYAGVSGSPEGNNDIIIRGNSPGGLLWRLEGIEIPNPNHFSEEGATGGPISILNGNMLDNSDFYTGAFPAEYGNAYSGVFDLNLRNGNNRKREYSFMAGVLGVDCSAEGPFVQGKDASYLVNYRYSSLALMNTLGIKIVGDAVPKYQDASFKVTMPKTKLGSFSLFGIGGLSNVQEEYDDYKNDFATNMGVLGVTNRVHVSDNCYLNTTLGVTGSSNVWEYHEPNDENVFRKLASENFFYKTARLNSTLQCKISPRITARSGIVISHLQFDLFSDYRDSLEMLITDVEKDGYTNLYEGFTNWKIKAGKDVTFQAGLHFTQLGLNNANSIEPRFGARWKVKPNHTLTFGAGMHSKILPITNYYAVFEKDGVVAQHNKNIDLQKAVHLVAGYETMLSKNLFAKVESYYQYLYNIPVEADTASAFSIVNYTYGYVTMPLKNNGVGVNYGVDLTLEKFFSDNYYFVFTSSLYNSKYKGSDSKQNNTMFNGNYVLNLLGGREFAISKKENPRILTISTKGTIAGGRRYTPIDLEKSIAKNETVRNENKPFMEQRPMFTRIDLKLSLRKNTLRTTRTWELDIQNVTNTQNIAGDYFYEGKVQTYTQLGILPVLSYKVQF